jgi:hypothetical protein
MLMMVEEEKPCSTNITRKFYLSIRYSFNRNKKKTGQTIHHDSLGQIMGDALRLLNYIITIYTSPAAVFARSVKTQQYKCYLDDTFARLFILQMTLHAVVQALRIQALFDKLVNFKSS